MKSTYFSFVFAVLIIFSGCVSDQENSQVIFERDVKAIQDYLARNPIASVKKLEDNASGISIYWTELSGSGILPAVGDSVYVDYIGRLLNGTVFDTSIESAARANNIFSPNRRYAPLDLRFGLGQVIPGFEFALSKMEKGDKATVFMPSLYGYGSNPVGSIPANSPLAFELEIINIVKPRN
jgi:FKBP-type peptidyl-prolyl cis-trans isomerase